MSVTTMNDTSSTGTAQRPFYALLVGIDEYKHPMVNDLRGCVNDVRSVQETLVRRFGVPEENILTLTDAQATHQAIKDAFRTHLIDRARAWDAAGRPGEPPAFLFHYSGHGSQALDVTGTEPDGLDETIVPHDSRTEGVYDIKDWELGLLAGELAAISDNVTIVLDSCHSGSGLRGEDQALARRIPPDLRPQPTQRPPEQRSTRSLTGPSDWLEGGHYVLIAGCRDRELSNEYLPREGSRTDWQGAMTYFLVRELNALPPGQAVTYAELHRRVRHHVNSVYPQQTPQCEGDLNRELFGGLRPESEALFNVVDRSEGLVWIDGGLVHGLTTGSLLKVYPEGTRLTRDAQPIATLKIEEARGTRSGCIPTGGESIPLHSRAAVHMLNLGNMRRKVALAVEDGGLLEAVIDRLSSDDIRSYVQVSGEGAGLRLAEVEGRLQLQDAAGTVLAAYPLPQDPQALPVLLNELVRDLAHIVRCQNALELENRSPDSELQGALKLALRRLEFDPDTQEPRPGEEIPLDAGGERLVETGQAVVLEITNQSSRPLYFAVFDFPYDWGVYQVYPQVRGAHEALEPGKPFYLGLDRQRSRQLRASLPDPQVLEAREVLKVIATVEDTDFEILRQGALKSAYQVPDVRTRGGGPPSALEQLLRQAAAGGSQTRHFGGAAARVEDDWTTASIEVHVVRVPEEETAPLVEGQRSSLPGYPLEIEAPQGFSGRARVLTPRQSARAAGLPGGPGLQPPPGLAAHSDLFQPLALNPTRASNPEASVIEIQADEAARQAISPENPLRIHLQGASTRDGQAQGILAVAFDGEFYHLVGRSGEDPSVVEVEWLPEPEPEEPQPGKRGLIRTAKLYLYKIMGWSEPSLGLHKARFVPLERLTEDNPEPDERSYERKGGEVRYRRLRAGELKAGQRAALFIHGFTSDSHWMVGGSAHHLQASGAGYDYILTFNYESFNTPVAENAQTLASLLRAAGFGPDDGVTLDIYAHSMGTLVTRALIELAGGDEFVDRAFLAGPPNEGTRLAELKRFIPWIGAIILNNVTPSPPTVVASWVLKKLESEAVSIEDIRPGSTLLKQLNTSSKPAQVPYYILAGRNLILPAQEEGLKRLAHKVAQGTDAILDFVFSDQNDLLLPVSSMTTVRGGKYPLDKLNVQVLPCNHFGYFDTPEAQQKLAAWVKPADAAADTPPEAAAPGAPVAPEPV